LIGRSKEEKKAGITKLRQKKKSKYKRRFPIKIYKFVAILIFEFEEEFRNSILKSTSD
jgi:hypothetical protein